MIACHECDLLYHLPALAGGKRGQMLSLRGGIARPQAQQDMN
jgi:hypothetical protein